MISPLRKPGRYGLSGRGCLPGHLARAHAGGNSSNSLSKDLDRFLLNWQGPGWVAVVVVDAEVWELKLPRSVMPGCLCGRAAPPSMACMAAADARVHAFDELCPQCTACDKLRCERLSILVSGCALRLEACRDESERSRGMPCAEDSSGHGASSRELERTRWSSESRRHAPTTLLRLKETSQSVRRYL